MSEHLQPFLHDLELVFRAPTQAWSGPDGQIRRSAPGRATVQGVLHSDVRVLCEAVLTVDGAEAEPAGTLREGGTVTFVGLPRHVDQPGADPTVRLLRTRSAEPGSVSETLELRCATTEPTTARLSVTLSSDMAAMEVIKSGGTSDAVPAVRTPSGLVWTTDDVTAAVEAEGADVDLADRARPVLRWTLTAAAGRPARVTWRLVVHDSIAVVTGVRTPSPLVVPAIDASADLRPRRFLDQSLADLDRLRMALPSLPDQEFLAAGAPWFFTLFGRDSLWAARFLLPLGTELAEGTLTVLASLQGTADDPASQEEPGKILHELRRAALTLPSDGLALPPVYYGTVDATPLWVCVLHDAWRAGMPTENVGRLLPHAERALAWTVARARAGYLAYQDTTGHGLANQGWKDSGDSIQLRDGRLAEGPIELCEVQAYAHEALVHGADLFEAFGHPGVDADGTTPDALRAAAADLAERFRRDFWLEDEHGPYVAIALDGRGAPVDTVTSNMGHLPGTGLLRPDEEDVVARRLVHPELSSGFGLRTMATSSAGYWPLKYHGGSVWAHDTAIAVRGLLASGHRAQAQLLAEGLLRAAESFGYRVPELYSGDPATGPTPHALPYPAACRPQAWSAASAVVVAQALGLL
ncbi:glycogen debranching N-terminal domain-containing protein [Cellulomonas sp. SG140]|uniref:glycogen debranching N-terminal domain-containing protein n=1 Tax=Cellulomonas sp. SG140 TaxID=2976536 RepID=UPI0021E999B2|nr:glycogen debranching N-terminal domain-containing protein [Cellulomonas sp. SG140]